MARVSFDFLDGSDSESDGDSEAGDALLRALFGGGEAEDDDVSSDNGDSSTAILQDWQSPQTRCAQMPREVERGSTEYKLKLIGCTAERVQELTTQMKWRLEAGSGSASYFIGVEDEGFPRGLDPDELERSIATVRRLAAAADAVVCTVERKLGATGSRRVARLTVRRRIAASAELPELRVAVLGSAACGKTTLVAVLARGVIDNGAGVARMHVLRHLHEAEAGTSSINRQLLGWDVDGVPTNLSAHARVGVQSQRAVVAASARLVELLDLAGAAKYLKTTLLGLTGQRPDYVALLVDATKGVESVTREHLALAVALALPVFVVITKSDACVEPGEAAELDAALTAVHECLRAPGIGRAARRVESMDGAAVAAASFGGGEGGGDCDVPIFVVSSVSQHNVELLRSFLSQLPVWRDWAAVRDGASEVFVSEVFGGGSGGNARRLRCSSWSRSSSPSLDEAEARADGDVGDEGGRRGGGDVGALSTSTATAAIVCGTVCRGIIAVGDELVLGPTASGVFTRAAVQSIESFHFPVQTVGAGHTATFSLLLDSTSTSATGVSSSSSPTMTAIAMTTDQPASPTCSSAIATPAMPTTSTTTISKVKQLGRGSARRERERKGPCRGMVLASPSMKPVATWSFEADVVVLRHPEGCTVGVHTHKSVRYMKGVCTCPYDLCTTCFGAVHSSRNRPVKQKQKLLETCRTGVNKSESGLRAGATHDVSCSEWVVLMNNCRQTASLVAIADERPQLLGGDKGRVTFRFCHHAEYVKLGSKFVFHGGKSRGVGIVVSAS